MSPVFSVSITRRIFRGGGGLLAATSTPIGILKLRKYVPLLEPTPVRDILAYTTRRLQPNQPQKEMDLCTPLVFRSFVLRVRPKHLIMRCSEDDI